jgi:hypothetical protein
MLRSILKKPADTWITMWFRFDRETHKFNNMVNIQFDRSRRPSDF